ncbi:5-demethoxyubiquinol-8 5-hydroxylase UbiM [Fontimonas sp. SYSU GA230001]|uniref:5-demethoxyubiquinol-8 5-hydroxylase UbiM n=1 Tax=Fontimonas sp. SYSU GA230001 TaxID=3142450 RepID=UPI0032B326EA
MSGHQDVLIIGAGPAGLALACALADRGLAVTLLERQARAALAAPQDDGREIALTHRAVGILETLGLWQRFDTRDIAPIRAARVLDGTSSGYLGFEPSGSGLDALGYLVPNHVIRKAAFDAALSRPSVRLRDDARIEHLSVDADAARVQLAGGETLSAPLLVAADSRFSDTRRQLGIGAEQRDFGRTVIVCRLAHDGPADSIAYECFGYGRTLAMLPLNDRQVSAVVTVSSDQTGALLRMPPGAFAASLQQQFGTRLGRLRLIGERYSYPLVAVYAHRFATQRAVLIGDAAVGMHPVTAHGYNLGLYGVDSLARTLGNARQCGQDLGDLAVLAQYEREHRRASRPLYLGTNALVGLYTDERAPARLLRGAVLRIAERLPPLKAAITHQLTGTRRSSITPPILR